jgi:nitroimidazol reductase NimA-like FMN-containing flavoprotein (pyridoxamine 5'-phosphate oxidase superfamily)
MTSSTQPGVTVLDEDTCWKLLASVEVGRLAVAVDGQPDIFPLNFAIDEHGLVFRTAEGTKLFALFIDSAVAFEADGFDPDSGNAWSVVIKGVAREIAMQDKVDTAYPVFPWSAWPKARFVRIDAHQVTGRQFHVVQHRPDVTA